MKRTAMPHRVAPLRRAPIKRTAGRPPRPRDTGPTRSVRAIVRGRAGGWCEWPACPRPLEHLHHRRPRRQGGDGRPDTNLPANCLGLCASHHMWIEAHPADARVFGLILTATADPTAVPVVTRHCPDPVLLDNEGGWTRAPE